MANTRVFSRSFAAGIIGPEMFGRIDDAKYQSGAAQMRNFIATPQGPAENRPGFAFVKPTKNNGIARLIPFTYSTDQTMVIEMGGGYIRFHTQGATLVYSSAPVEAWDPPSGDISLSATTPTIVAWAGHGLTSGDPVRFYMYAGHQTSELPAGFQVGYTYTADVIDANSFRILDNGIPVAISATGGGAVTNHPGSGTTFKSLYLAPNQTNSAVSPALGGLSMPVAAGTATLKVDIDSQIYQSQGGAGTIQYQYATSPGTWHTFHVSLVTEVLSVQVDIPITDLNQLALQVFLSGHTPATGTWDGNGIINAWSVDVPTTVGPGGLTIVRAYRYYTAGDIVLYAGNNYAAMKIDSGGLTTPGTDATIWSVLPADFVYEIPSPYAEADLFSIHYVQSADVMTLVHPLYPPYELRRLGAVNWTLTPIVFMPAILPPPNVQVAASPGYKATIQTITLASPALFITAANHTLSVGDQIYIANMIAVIGGVDTDKSGYYMVEDIPVNTSGDLILNQLHVMDYSGAPLDSSGWSTWHGAATIELSNRSFDPYSHYAVTAIAANGVDESILSPTVSALNNLDVPGSFNTVTWEARDGASRYSVYKQRNGLFGYIGETTGLTFVDDNIAPDFSVTPPNYDVIFAAPGDYPGAVSYYEQRRAFAGTINQPENLWMSNSGTESSFSYSLPVKATDRVAIRVAAREANTIRHIVPLTRLLLMTSAAEWAVIPVAADAITPTSIAVQPQSYVGANNVQPSVVNNLMVFCSARGGHVRELGYKWEANSFVTGDLSLRATQLFDNMTLIDQTYGKAPRPILWFVSSSGILLGLTYVPEEQIGSWHQHDTDGAFESACSVAEGNEDFLYAVIRRQVDGVTVRYVERMVSRLFPSRAECCFMDASVSFDGTGVGGSFNQLRSPYFQNNSDWQFQPGWGPGIITIPTPDWSGFHNAPGAVWTGPSPAGGSVVANLTRVVCSAGETMHAKCAAWADPATDGDGGLRVTFYSPANVQVGPTIYSAGMLRNGQWWGLSIDTPVPAGTAYAIVDFDMQNSTTSVGHWACGNFYGGAGLTTPPSAATTLTIGSIPATFPPETRTFDVPINASEPFFIATDVGDILILTLDDGSIARMTISSVTSPTVGLSNTPVGELDPLRGRTVVSWTWARDTFSGLDHLEGKTVAILADGAVLPTQVVEGGVVTLDQPATFVTIGLPYTCDLLTLPLILQIDGFGQGRNKNINKAWVRCWLSSGIFIGPDENHLIEAKQRTTEPYGSPPALQTDEVMVMTTPQWQQSGQILIRQVYPLPLTVVGLTLEVALGG